MKREILRSTVVILLIVLLITAFTAGCQGAPRTNHPMKPFVPNRKALLPYYRVPIKWNQGPYAERCHSYWYIEFWTLDNQLYHCMYAEVPGSMSPGIYASYYAEDNRFHYYRAKCYRLIYNPIKNRYERPFLNRDIRNTAPNFP